MIHILIHINHALATAADRVRIVISVSCEPVRGLYWHCWLSHLGCKNRPQNDLYVSSGSLRLYSLTQMMISNFWLSLTLACQLLSDSCRLLAVQHCYVGVTHKSSKNNLQLKDTVCSKQENVDHNVTAGQLADAAANYSIRLQFAISLWSMVIVLSCCKE